MQVGGLGRHRRFAAVEIGGECLPELRYSTSEHWVLLLITQIYREGERGRVEEREEERGGEMNSLKDLWLSNPTPAPQHTQHYHYF